MRHAKSSWDFPDLDDHDRPLNKRGVNSAKLICEFFVKKKVKFYNYHLFVLRYE